MHRSAILGLAAAVAVFGAAHAEQDAFPDIERPLYPEVLVETDDTYSSDAALLAFRDAIGTASEALVETPLGEAYDPSAMVRLLADEVELFVGQRRRPYRQEFISIGRQPAAQALEIVGRLSRSGDTDDALVQQRYGMHVLARLALEPTVGATPWLDGRVCTASYGRLEWPAWSALRQKLNRFDRDDWRIAVVTRRNDGDGLLVPGWPKRYQLVPVSPSQKRSGGSIGIVSPAGGTVFFDAMYDPREGHFAPYLNDHLCFEKRDGGWKISAVALRLD